MPSATVIANARVFDGAAVTPPRTVVIRDGMITDDTDQPAPRPSTRAAACCCPASSTPTCTSTAGPTSIDAPAPG